MVDIGEYAGTSADEWRRLREELKRIVHDVSADDDRLNKLEGEIAALRSANAGHLAALECLREVAFTEEKRADSLTLNDLGDGVVLDEDMSAIQKQPEEPTTTASAQEVAPRTQTKQSNAKKPGRAKTTLSKSSKTIEQDPIPFADPAEEEHAE